MNANIIMKSIARNWPQSLDEWSLVTRYVAGRELVPAEGSIIPPAQEGGTVQLKDLSGKSTRWLAVLGKQGSFLLGAPSKSAHRRKKAAAR